MKYDASQSAGEWDLTNKMTPYLDRHPVFPLLEFLSFKDIHDETDLLRSKLDLLSDTNMVDFAMDVHESLYPDKPLPSSLKDKRSEVVTTLKGLHDASQPVITLFSDPKIVAEIENSRDSKSTVEAHLEKAHINVEEMREKIYTLAKYEYDCGNYNGAAETLYFYRVFSSPSDKNYLNALWGKLASEILMQSWDKAIMDLKRLQSFIDEASFGSSLQTLQQRTWLIHWSLFVFFNKAEGTDAVIELFLYQKQYLNAIQTTCPWILRYLSTAVIVNKNSRRSIMKDLVKVIQEESYAYKDPITSFIEDLYVNFNFDGAQQKLRECEKVLVNDFFLVSCLDEFIENSRLMIFETFCRIHQCISIDMLAQKLNMKPENAERWIVNLIRNAKLDAKIDSQMGHVVMGKMTVSPYQQLIDKTKVLSLRTLALQVNLEKKKIVHDTPSWTGDAF
uniref:Eukaryotic translation initiation factor 3 subunit E n=1 Tax=Caligus rogercresseyi TaxID=217165 RepID=C1BNX2_CALRO|nr:Eukaryotic translation initiation factor 3 subunit E [Caligus rogercresseyi]